MTVFRWSRGGVLAPVLIALAVIVPVAYLALSAACPCERTPGGWLFGDTVDEPVDDWTFANDVPLCQIQVYRWGLVPHAINLNCMASEGELYLSCASCDGKVWSTAALAHPAARLKLGERVYPVRILRVMDPALLDEAWNARARKTGRGEGSPRQEGWWSFHVVSR